MPTWQIQFNCKDLKTADCRSLLRIEREQKKRSELKVRKQDNPLLNLHPPSNFSAAHAKNRGSAVAFAARRDCGRRCVCRWAFRLKNAHYLMCLTRPLGFVWYLKHTARSAGFHSSIILFLFILIIQSRAFSPPAAFWFDLFAEGWIWLAG